MKERVIKHALICFGIMLLLTIMALFSHTTHIGFFGYVITLTAGTLFTTLGFAIGWFIGLIATQGLLRNMGF